VRKLLVLAAIATLTACSFSQRTKVRTVLDITVGVVKTARAQLTALCLERPVDLPTLGRCVNAWKIMIGAEKALRTAYEALGHDDYKKAATYLAIARDGIERLLESLAQWAGPPTGARGSP
jgi:hypothetical protein